MKETREKLIGQKAKDDATMNFVSYQAQEAILDPNMPEDRKNEIVGAAVGTILRIAERRSSYNSGRKDGRRSRIIYDAKNDKDEERENPPAVIAELNEHLKKNAPEDMKDVTFEGIAERIGINKKILYEWAKSDTEFTTALGRLKEVQENDPFKTGTEEDYFVNSMMMALLLMETRDRHYKSQNQ